jgi:hypothetical protein
MTDEQLEQVIVDVLAVVEAHRRPRFHPVPRPLLDQPGPA